MSLFGRVWHLMLVVQRRWCWFRGVSDTWKRDVFHRTWHRVCFYSDGLGSLIGFSVEFEDHAIHLKQWPDITADDSLWKVCPLESVSCGKCVRTRQELETSIWHFAGPVFLSCLLDFDHFCAFDF